MHSMPYPPLSERVIQTVSLTELRRRWAALRAAMEADGIDVLLFHNLTDALAGYVRWVSDEWPSGGYPVSVVFPRDDDMTLVLHGPMNASQDLDPGADPYHRGVKRILHAASFVSVSYTRRYDAERLAEALAPYRSAKVGLVGPGHFPFPLMDHLRSEVPGAQFEDYTDAVDAIRAVKSDEEIAAIMRSASMQDEVFAELLGVIRPGLSETDLTAFLSDRSFRAGSECGLIMFGSGPEGDAPPFAPRRYQNRVLQAGDSVVMLFERDGPDGYYTELGRTLVLGKTPPEMLDEHEFIVQAQDFAASLLVPGVSGADVAAEYNDFLIGRGRPPEHRLHCHGQGYDIVERPLARRDETMQISARMNMAVHPQYSADGRSYWLCDNWLLDADGIANRIHTTERRIFECL